MPVKLVHVIIVACLVGFTTHVSANCLIKNAAILEATSVLVYQVVGQCHLVVQETVPSRAQVQVRCQNHVLDTLSCTEESFDHPFTKIKCNDQNDIWRPIVQEHKFDNNCPASKTKYRVGYQLGDDFFELYKVCFDPETKSPLFTTHRAYSFSITSKRPSPFWDFNPAVTPLEGRAMRREDTKLKIQQLLGTNILVDRGMNEIDRGHLVPGMDFMFSQHKEATFKFINIVPQWASINQGNWNEMEKFVNFRLTQDAHRDQPRLGEYATIITGAFGVLELEHIDKSRGKIPMYLLGRQHLPIPEWMYKVVSLNGACTVYLTYNNIRATPIQTPTPICQTVACPLSLPMDRQLGETYCCDVKDFKRKVMPNLDIC